MYQFEFHPRLGIVLSAVVRIANIFGTTVVRTAKIIDTTVVRIAKIIARIIGTTVVPIVVGYTGIFQSASLDHPDLSSLDERRFE